MDERLKTDPSITRVVLIHCETGTGVENPRRGAAVCRKHGKGLIVDAMSVLRRCRSTHELQFDALIAASGKCLKACPAWASSSGKVLLDACAGNSRAWRWTCDQHVYMGKTGQWRSRRRRM